MSRAEKLIESVINEEKRQSHVFKLKVNWKGPATPDEVLSWLEINVDEAIYNAGDTSVYDKAEKNIVGEIIDSKTTK